LNLPNAKAPIVEDGALLISEQEAYLLTKVHGKQTKDLTIVRKALGSLWVTGYTNAMERTLERFRKWRVGTV
jgi:hypothetical protein